MTVNHQTRETGKAGIYLSVHDRLMERDQCTPLAIVAYFEKVSADGGEYASTRNDVIVFIEPPMIERNVLVVGVRGDANSMSSSAPIIHVVDDDASFRSALGRLLQAAGYRIALYESANQLLERPPKDEPGCILLDLQMTGLNGLELQDRLVQQGHALPIVFLTGHGDIAKGVRAIKAGAEDFLQKPVAKEDLFEAVERALCHYNEARVANTKLGSLRALVATLTPREREVFNLVVRGKLNKQVAHELGTAERTVKAHRHSIMLKLNVRSLAEAVSIAERVGILAALDASHDRHPE